MNKKYILAGVVIVLSIIGICVGMGGNNVKTIEEGTGTAINNTNKPVGSKPGSTNTSSNKPVTSTGKPSVTATLLEGNTFRLISYNGVPTMSDSKYTLSFENGSIVAKFCNSLSGNYVLDQGNIKSSNLVSTKMYCGVPSNLMDMETSFTSILNFGANISKVDKNLMISGPKGSIFIFSGFTN